MYIICEVCNGTGKVDKDFALGKCKEIEGDYYHRVCPACDGKGLQWKKDDVEVIKRYKSWPLCPKKKKTTPYDPFNPCPNPYKPHHDPPWNPDPFNPCKRRKKPNEYRISS